MAQLRHDYQKILSKDTLVVVVGPESPKRFRNFWKDNDLPFIGLPDAAHKVLKQFGQEVNIFKLGRLPAQVIIDKKGIARYVHYGHDISDIPSTEEILAILDEVNRVYMRKNY